MTVLNRKPLVFDTLSKRHVANSDYRKHTVDNKLGFLALDARSTRCLHTHSQVWLRNALDPLETLLKHDFAILMVRHVANGAYCNYPVHN